MASINASTSGAGGVITTSDATGTLQLQSASTTVATINAYGIGLGTGVPSSGIGITFPATQSASSNANTLDDYEEGNWTPVWSATSGSMSYASQIGEYVKVGKLVMATCHIITTANNSLSGGVILNGLPFANDSTTSNYTVGSLHVEQVNLAASAWIWAYVPPGGTTANFRFWVNNAAAGTVVGSNLNAGSDVMFTVTYLASA